jgi:hypothetical protein
MASTNEGMAAHYPEGSGSGTEIISGRLAAYRVLQVGPWYSDRDGSLQHLTPQNDSGAQLAVTFGDLPPSLLHDVSNATPLVDGSESTLRALQHGELPELDRDTADLTLAQPEFVEAGATYLTIGYVCPAVMEALPDRWAFWVANAKSALGQLNSFAREAEDTLDRACARLVGAGTPINSIVHTSRKVYFEPGDDNHMPVVRGEIRFGAQGHVSVSGWESFNSGPMFDVLDAAVAPRDLDKAVATPSWFYFQAMNETDQLRRFLFAHWGLEVLAAKFCKAHRDSLTSRIVSELGLPAKSLFWPTPAGSDRPARNIEFQFALMAWALRSSAAQADIDEFKDLAEIRNKLSHGERVDHASLPREDGVRLLRKYLTLVATNYQASRVR